MKWSALAERVHQSIKRRNLLQEGDKILVAVSGGMDSVVLLHVLLELRDYWKWELAVGHIDHGLRPGEDPKERQLCSDIAANAKLEYCEYTIHLSTANCRGPQIFHGTQKHSLESLARQERYKDFGKMADELNCNVVCTGHHKSDQAETVLYRMLTGSGFKGIRGIPASRDIFKRPLLDISKKEIIKYAKNRKLKYLDDSSNEDETFKRNKIRKTIIPFLEKNGFPNTTSMLASTTVAIEEANEALEFYFNEAFNKAVVNDKNSVKIVIDQLITLPKHIQKRILRKACSRYLLIEKHLSEKQLDQLISFIFRADPGSHMVLMGKKLLKDRGVLYFNADSPESYIWEFICVPSSLMLKHSLEIEVVDITQNTSLIPGNSQTAYFSYELLYWEMVIKHWEPGDSMTLFGSGQTKKVSDILKDEKVSALEKTDHPVLMTGGDIIWIPGVKRSNLYKVNPNDDRMIKITYSKMEKDNDQKNLNT